MNDPTHMAYNPTAIALYVFCGRSDLVPKYMPAKACSHMSQKECH